MSKAVLGLPPPQSPYSHLTACRTRLSSGLRLGSLVEERMPVPQLLASVFLRACGDGGVCQWLGSPPTLSPRPPGPDLPVKEGSEQPAQQDLVACPRADVAVHKLGPGDVDIGA